MLFERYKKLPPSPKEAGDLPRAGTTNANTNSARSDAQQTLGMVSTAPSSPPQRDQLQLSSPTQPEKMSQTPQDQPLACLFYFFYSQLSQHANTRPDADLVARHRQHPTRSVHALDTHLTRLQMHASFSPLIKSFEQFPIAIDPSVAALSRGRERQWQPKFSFSSFDDASDSVSARDENRGRDTVLLVQFQSKAAREQWLQSPEWREFYAKVNDGDGVCRQMPHVRCARSLRGLMDIKDVLSA